MRWLLNILAAKFKQPSSTFSPVKINTPLYHFVFAERFIPT